MIYPMHQVASHFTESRNTREIRPGQWVPARPMDGSKINRLKAAWAVLIGEADAFRWPCGQREHL